MSDLFGYYQEELQNAIGSLSKEAVTNLAEAIMCAHQTGGTIYTCGNGGSASTASHMVCDLVKNTKNYIRVNCLSDNVPIFSALANDDEYKRTFYIQLYKWMKPQDLLIAISTSGRSQNILYSFRAARMREAEIFLLTGNDRNSLAVRDLKTYPKATVIFVDSDNIGVVEDCHLVINHMITELLREMSA